MRARQRSRDAGGTRAAMNKAPGVARGFASGLLLRGRTFCGNPAVHFSGKCSFCLVAFSAENRKSTFPENASFAWSHFLRKTGNPLFRKMLQ
jgi:hypothetical protein